MQIDNYNIFTRSQTSNSLCSSLLNVAPERSTAGTRTNHNYWSISGLRKADCPIFDPNRHSVKLSWQEITYRMNTIWNRFRISIANKSECKPGSGFRLARYVEQTPRRGNTSFVLYLTNATSSWISFLFACTISNKYSMVGLV